ncbi:MAG: DUF5615 family PIN-like protein [Candidatus Omnitrophica bacterium]|nr:DUF5615 family PIN-like protein [Candidatus Omnitrophota bacterium]
MTIFADQCINYSLIEALKNAGTKTITASQSKLSCASDDEIFRHIVKNDYPLITFDKDFGNILRFDIKRTAGVIIIYIENMNRNEIIDNTVSFFRQFNQSKLQGRLFIIERTQIRIWPK